MVKFTRLSSCTRVSEIKQDRIVDPVLTYVQIDKSTSPRYLPLTHFKKLVIAILV